MLHRGRSDLYAMVEEYFRTSFVTGNELITEAVRRMLAAGGKRLRPRFTLLAAESAGGRAGDDRRPVNRCPAMAPMVGGGPLVSALLVLLLLLALALSIITAMAGSSRTLYQGSIDGWLPRYLSHVNAHGAPTRAMWTDLAFNLILLLMSDYVFVLAVSNCCYLIFNFLNLNAGWIHRVDSPRANRPWRAPDALLAAGAVLAFVNAFLLGAGSNVYGKAGLLTGLLAAAWRRLASSVIGPAFTTASTLLGVAQLGFRGQLIEIDLTAALPD